MFGKHDYILPFWSVFEDEWEWWIFVDGFLLAIERCGWMYCHCSHHRARGHDLGMRTFPANRCPLYLKGMRIWTEFCFLVAVLASMLTLSLWRESEKRDQIYGAGISLDALDELADAGSLRE